MKYNKIKKIKRNKTWTKVDIPSINLSPDRCTKLSLEPCQRKKWGHNPIQLHDVTTATYRALLRTRVNGTEIVFKSALKNNYISSGPKAKP